MNEQKDKAVCENCGRSLGTDAQSLALGFCSGRCARVGEARQSKKIRTPIPIEQSVNPYVLPPLAKTDAEKRRELVTNKAVVDELYAKTAPDSENHKQLALIKRVLEDLLKNLAPQTKQATVRLTYRLPDGTSCVQVREMDVPKNARLEAVRVEEDGKPLWDVIMPEDGKS